MTDPAVSLGEVTEVLSGFAFKSEQFGDSGDLPVVRIRDVVRGHSTTFYTGQYSEKYIVKDGDLLIGMDGEFNRARWRGGTALLNQRVCRISSSNGSLDESYLYHFLPAALKEIERQTPFVTVKHLSSQQIKQIPISLPPIEEQRRVASVLDAADTLRVARRKALAKFDKLTGAVFIEMFGDPVANPLRWRADRVLDDVANIRSGITMGRKTGSAALTSVPYLTVVNVQDGFIELQPLKTIDATKEEVERFRLSAGDILLTEGGDPDKLGRGAVWDASVNPCIHQNHVFRVRVTGNEMTSLFLSHLLGSPRGKRYFLRMAKQTTGIASINMSQLRSFPILEPPLDLQVEYLRRVAGLDQFRTQVVRSEAELESLFASLQQWAFRGEL